jgi:asparagine synthase (glutamine-hydrolysing)
MKQDTSHIHLTGKQGFSWHKADRIWFKGYFFCPHGSYHEGPEAAKLFEGIQHPGQLEDMIKPMNGIFSAAIDTPAGILLGTDPLGLFSIFYTRKQGKWHVSDSSSLLADLHHQNVLNQSVLPAFLSAGFVPGNETLYQDVFRCRPGEIVLLPENQDAISLTYHHFVNPHESNAGQTELQQSLAHVLHNGTERMLRFLNGRTALIPLSGGYDSRLILAMLKNSGYEKVICFTYGTYNKETTISEEMAKKAGYPWLFIDYAKIDSKGFLQTRQFREYCELAGNGFAMPYLQEYFAINHLKEQQLVPDDAAFLPGHPGDFLAGKQLGKLNRNTKPDQIIPEIRRAYFDFIPLNVKNQKMIEKQIAAELKPVFETYKLPPEKTYQYMEAWDLKEKRAKFICQSALVFPFFGYAFYLPLWDKELRDFLREVPLQQRKGKQLYDKVLEGQFFRPLGLVSEKDSENKVSRFMLFRYHLLRKAKTFFPSPIIKRRLQKRDWICYKRFTDEMVDEMKQQNQYITGRYYSFNALICQWYVSNLRNRT